MKLPVFLVFLVVISTSCDCKSSKNASSEEESHRNAYKIVENDVKLFKNFEQNLFKYFLTNNSSQECKDDVKFLLKALSNYELWALKSIKNNTSFIN